MVRRRVRVLAAGTFDFLHPGHAAFLNAARRLGDELIVVVARDARATKIKGRRPVFTQAERTQLIAQLKPVTRAVPGGAGDVLAVVCRLRPDVVALGPDQWIDDEWLAQQLRSHGLNPKIVRIRAYKKSRYSSGRIARLVARRDSRNKRQHHP